MLTLLLAVIAHSHGVAGHGQGPIFQHEPPPWLELTNSSGGTLSCSAQGTPQPDIRWLDHTDKEVTHIPRLREVLLNGSLFFPPFAAEEFRPDVHSATYRCLATNPIGTIVSRASKLRPDMQGTYPLRAEDAVVLQGNVAVLRCSVASSAHHFLTWLHDEPLIGRSAVHAGGRYVITSTGALHVRDTSQVDSYSRFYCQTVNKVTGERRLSPAAKIIITEPNDNIPPRIENSVSSVHARIGSSTELICAAQGSPPPQYRWYKEKGDSLEELLPGSISVRPLDSVLQLPRVRAEDGGRYVCVASNVLGEDRRELLLSVASALSVHVRPQYQAVDGGSSAVFNCSVQGGSGGGSGGGETPSVQWLKDGRPLLEGGQVGFVRGGGGGGSETLLMRSVTKHNRGMYQCFARSGDETAQASAELALGAIPPELQSTFIEQTVQPGVTVSLRCVASGNPPPRVTWRLDGGVLPAQAAYMFGSFHDPSTGDVVSHLNLTHVHVQHGGLYTCVARNNLASVEHSAALNVYGPPTARQGAVNVTAVSGGSAWLRCPVAGFPVSGTTWQRRAESLPAHYRHRLFANGTLLVARVDSGLDAGEYRCTVRNQQGQAATGRLYLEIMKPPQIQPFQFPDNLQEGHRAQVSCTIISGDFPVDISWYKDGRPLTQEPDVQQQVHQFVNALFFSKLGAHHSGHYTCIARNAAAQTNFTAKLIIKVAPTWAIEPQDVSVLYQQPAVIRCQANGFPPPLITWMKTSGEDPSDFMQIETTPGLSVFSNGTIYIRSTDSTHEGQYSCHANNGIGNVLKKTIFLRVNVPAHFATRTVNRSGVAGEEVTLTCEVDGDLPVQVLWSASPRLHLPPAHSRHTARGVASEIRFINVTRRDAGTYHCNAHNHYGQDSMTIHLAVKEPPDVPSRVELVEVGSRWVSVRWAAGGGGDQAPITQYLVQFQPVHASSQQVWSNVSVGGAVHSAHLSALSPASGYQVRVLAVNEVGVSAPSPPIVANTLQEAPSAAPEGVTADDISPETLMIKWKTPLSLSDEEVLGYQVSFREVTRGAPQTRTVRGRLKQQLLLTGLRHFARYEITVRAFNQVGLGATSAPIVATTTEGVPDQPPLEVRCSALSSQSLRIRWEPPHQDHTNGILQGYKIIYKYVSPHPENVAEIEVKKTTNLETNLHGLFKSANYSIRVVAFTGTGEGVASAPIYCLTQEDVPGPPEQVKALVMTSESILVTWTRPLEPNGKIIKYNIYIVQPDKETVKEISFEDDVHAYECRRLKEFQRYEFWVSASTSIGEGQPSVKITQTPLSRVPARIASFSGRVVGTAGSKLILGCHTVGLPAPTRVWRDPTGAILTHNSGTHKVADTGSLVVSPLWRDMAGNYSCQAENVFGRDQVVYHVVVIIPPAPPTLGVSSTSTHSIALQWKIASNGGSQINGYILNYRPKNKEWQQITLDADRRTYNLDKLSCGTQYEVYLQASNAVGKGKASQILITSTKGDVPGVAEQDDLLSVNSTSATIFLESFPSGACPIKQVGASYRAQGDQTWHSLGSELGPHDEVTIPNLKPATRYYLRLVAANDAGITRQEYVFATRSKNGELIPLELIPEQPSSSLLAQLNVLIPLTSAILCAIALSSFACLLFRRRQYSGYKAAEISGGKSLVELENQRNNDQQGRTYSPSPARKLDSSLSVHKGSDTSDYEICPYATFSLPTQPVGHSLQFQTFSQRDCYEGRPMKDFQHYSRTRSRAGTSKSPPDGLSLEIACISSQQTLPVGRKGGGGGKGPTGGGGGGVVGGGGSTTFMSDSDSSGDKPPRHRNPTPGLTQRNTESTVFELDSSTESAEASPEVARRHVTRRGVPPR
ncbi:Down syndrome cell adhesion molecule-like protein Dscam2 isoform X4 [Nilaparvata lugens]|nr:Down syndrome cell adhesion molecule-like protein Dscam2 isoform X4 [Nilaparvata lugens]